MDSTKLNPSSIEDAEQIFQDNLEKAEKIGDGITLVTVGLCYQNGYGTPTNPKKAAEYFQRAANVGSPEGMAHLAFCYQTGIGVFVDDAKAFKLFETAAELGNPEAMIGLGFILKDGTGNQPKNLKKAFQYFEKAANAGSAEGMNAIALCYHDGTGVKKDQKKAFEWMEKSAKMKNSSALIFLGQFYQNGTGVAANAETGFSYIKQAAKEHSDPQAYFVLASCYREGRGTKKNLHKFQKALEEMRKIDPTFENVNPEISEFMNRYQICRTCRKEGAKMKCSRCLIVYYCSRECQVVDWKQGHKQGCLQ